MRFQTVNGCDDTQAIADAQQIFRWLEHVGQREGVGPDRMARALLELAAGWHAVVLAAHGPESGGPIANELERITRSFEEALRRETARLHESTVFTKED